MSIYSSVSSQAMSIRIPFDEELVDQTNLCKRQRLRGGTASSANALLDQCHGELLVGHAVSGAAHVFRLSAGDVKVYTQKNIFLQ